MDKNIENHESCTDLGPVSIQLPDWDEPATGRLLHRPAVALLELIYTDGETEVLSVDLAEHGLTAAPDEVWVRDWSEHAGLPEALVAAGAVEILQRRPIGPFDAVAVLCRLRRTEQRVVADDVEENQSKNKNQEA